MGKQENKAPLEFIDDRHIIPKEIMDMSLDELRDKARELEIKYYGRPLDELHRVEV